MAVRRTTHMSQVEILRSKTKLSQDEVLAAMRTLAVLAMDIAGDSIDEAIVEQFYSAPLLGTKVHFKISVEKLQQLPANPDAN